MRHQVIESLRVVGAGVFCLLTALAGAYAVVCLWFSAFNENPTNDAGLLGSGPHMLGFFAGVMVALGLAQVVRWLRDY